MLTCPAERLTEPITGLVTGLTNTLKLSVALKLVPLSVTATVTRLVVLAWLTGARQLKRAFVGFKGVSVAPAGLLSKLKVSVFGGTAASVATLVTSTVWPTFMV